MAHWEKTAVEGVWRWQTLEPETTGEGGCAFGVGPIVLTSVISFQRKSWASPESSLSF